MQCYLQECIGGQLVSSACEPVEIARSCFRVLALKVIVLRIKAAIERLNYVDNVVLESVESRVGLADRVGRCGQIVVDIVHLGLKASNIAAKLALSLAHQSEWIVKSGLIVAQSCLQSGTVRCRAHRGHGC